MLIPRKEPDLWRNITTRYLLTCAAIGVAGSLALMPIFIIFSAAAVAAAPVVYAVVVGIWFLPGALAQSRSASRRRCGWPDC